MAAANLVRVAVTAAAATARLMVQQPALVRCQGRPGCRDLPSQSKKSKPSVSPSTVLKNYADSAGAGLLQQKLTLALLCMRIPRRDLGSGETRRKEGASCASYSMIRPI